MRHHTAPAVAHLASVHTRVLSSATVAVKPEMCARRHVMVALKCGDNQSKLFKLQEHRVQKSETCAARVHKVQSDLSACSCVLDVRGLEFHVVAFRFNFSVFTSMSVCWCMWGRRPIIVSLHYLKEMA